MSFRRLIWWELAFSVLLSLPASAQTDPIAWRPNIEAAKAEARQTNRLVLVHFWTEECAPCMALERNVFNQPEVANALQSQFVPVKLNANDNQATASSLGVARIPCDVVLTPDGQVVDKGISPNTPMAYIARLTQVAGNYAGRSGQTFAGAATAAPLPSQMNSVYAGLSVAPSTPPALAGDATQRLATNPYATGGPFVAPQSPLPAANAIKQAALPTPPATTAGTPITPIAPAIERASPAMVDNRYAQAMPNATAPTQPANAASQVPSRYASQQQAPPATSTAMPGSPQTPPASQTVANQYASPNPPTPANQVAPTNQYASPAPAAPLAAPMLGSAASQAGPSIGEVASTVPDPRQLPPGAMPLGFDGYCPVSMRNSNLSKWVAGNPKFGVQHRGRTYWFAGPKEQQQFLANPDFYAPALSGLDPVLAIDHRQQVPGRREHSVDYDNLFYMFTSEASLQQFVANPEHYASSVRQAMGIQRGRIVR